MGIDEAGFLRTFETFFAGFGLGCNFEAFEGFVGCFFAAVGVGAGVGGSSSSDNAVTSCSGMLFTKRVINAGMYDAPMKIGGGGGT